ncbi:MAG: tyrosine-type recombinase/integrase [Lachnospiraceae bacterium]|jgi:integrase|nr:tyrosine-type recombinase/integrase [Lachnospiraceae bacterium]
MSDYVSAAAPLFVKFEKYMTISNKWNTCYNRNLHKFDVYCLERNLKTELISQELINEWCQKRPQEINRTCVTRSYVIVMLTKFINKRGLGRLLPPVLPKVGHGTFRPHYFTDEELADFFNHCDNLNFRIHCPQNQLTMIQVPVFFRLLYSSGMRTLEARMLTVDDVDLNTGIVSVNKSKGNDQHYVVLHDSTLLLLKKYDDLIRTNQTFENRKYFFPDIDDNPHDSAWVTRYFNRCWNRKQYGKARAYDLRHNYAIANINSWSELGFECNAKFYYLSKSMGHARLRSTQYYYSLTPVMADILLEKTNDSFNEIIPDLDYE